MHTSKFLIALCVFGLMVTAAAQSQVTPPKSGTVTKDSQKALLEQKAKQEKNRATPPRKKDDVPNVPLTAARITFDHLVFDFGDVPGGTKVTHYFPVKNTGPDTLVITRIKAG
jgi:hypothetical protein